MKPDRVGRVDNELIPLDRVERRILQIRGRRVILDADLAELYGVPTRTLNQAVRRNANRFPADFAFPLSPKESAAMRSQIVTASKRNVRHRPIAFTEHGAIMAANMLNSRRAVKASVFVVRAFVRLRGALTAHEELTRKLAELEQKVGHHDGAIREIVKALRELMEAPPDPPRERIGFVRKS